MGYPDAIRFGYGKTLSGVITKTEPWDKIAKVITGKLRVYESKADSTNAPNILGGPTDNRGKEDRNILARSLLTMDYDDLPADFEVEDMAFALDMLGYAAVCYTTFSHRTERADGGVRLRVIVPLEREIECRAYADAVREFTDKIGIECSPESYTVAQVMFLHSAMKGFEDQAWTHVVGGDAYPVNEAWGNGNEDGDDDDDLLLDIAYEPLDVSDAEVDKALEMMVAEGLEYDDWLMVGAALWHQYRGDLGDEGFGRWLEWSRKSSKHDGKLMRKKWKSFGGRGRPLTMASVFARVGGLSVVREALGDGDGEVGGEGGEVVATEPKGALAIMEKICVAAQKIEDIADYEKLKQSVVRIPEARLGSDYRGMIAEEIFSVWGKGAGLTKGDIKKALASGKGKSKGVKRGGGVEDGLGVLTEADCWDEERPAWLRGWVFDERDAEFVRVDNGHAVKRESFRMMYDRMGECAEHEMDAIGLASKVFPIPTVSGRMYWPGNGKVFQMQGSGLVYLNTWMGEKAAGGADVAAEGSFEIGDDSLEGQACRVFLDHLERTVPDKRERGLVLDWMAWVYNNPGSRVRWALLLWGIEGNGKSYFHRVLTWLMGRDSRTVAASLIEERFTDWAEGCRLIGIEEIRVSGTNKWRTLDKMKPFISNDEIQVEGKGKAARVVPNFASYMLFTNHADAIPVGDGDRRYFVVFTKHRTKEDLLDEHGGEEGVGRYFQTLFDVSRAGIGGIARLLAEHQYGSEFDPHGRAPDSSGKAEMRMLHVSEDDEALSDALERFHGPYINDKIIDLTELQEACIFTDDLELPKTSILAHKLVEMGYSKGGRIKARSKRRTFWYQPNKITLENAEKAMRSGIEQIDPDIPF